MNGHMGSRRHLAWMVGAAAAVLGVLVVFGVPLATALPYAVFLACPLMMMVMMGSMNHGDAHTDHAAHTEHDALARSAEPGVPDPVEEPDAQRRMLR